DVCAHVHERASARPNDGTVEAPIVRSFTRPFLALPELLRRDHTPRIEGSGAQRGRGWTGGHASPPKALCERHTLLRVPRRLKVVRIGYAQTHEPWSSDLLAGRGHC